MKFKYHRRFSKNYKKRVKPYHKLQQQFNKRLSLFLKDPYSPLLKDHQLVGKLATYRAFSITGDIRVIYRIQDNTLLLYDIGTHNQVYK